MQAEVNLFEAKDKRSPGEEFDLKDSKEKLQYDLYYLKNHSIFLDVIILVQTIELVLVGEGSR